MAGKKLEKAHKISKIVLMLPTRVKTGKTGELNRLLRCSDEQLLAKKTNLNLTE
jgi:hypothetical protein